MTSKIENFTFCEFTFKEYKTKEKLLGKNILMKSQNCDMEFSYFCFDHLSFHVNRLKLEPFPVESKKFYSLHFVYPKLTSIRFCTRKN